MTAKQAETSSLSENRARHMATLTAVQAVWIERATELGLKGKKADAAAIDFLVGVRIGFIAADPKLLALPPGERGTPVDGMIWHASVRGAKAITEWQDA